MATRTARQDPAAIDTSTPEGRRTWKENASRILNEGASRRRLCEAYDQRMTEVGLLPRQRYLDELKASAKSRVNRFGKNPFIKVELVEGPVVAVEDTEEAFNAWKVETARTLTKWADEAGIETAHDVLARAGFPTRIERQVVVRGTFEVPQTVKVFEGEDVIDAVKRGEVAGQVHNVLYYEEGSPYRQREAERGVTVDWKAEVVEGS